MGDQSMVYVVDDDEAVRASLQWMLEGAGMAVRGFGTAPAFLEALDQLETGTAACALVDLRLPGMSGLELLEHLRARRIGLPVVMITGHGDVAAAVRAMKAGALDFVEKPFDEQYLLDRVDEALRTGANQMRAAADEAELRERFSRLSRRERQVIRLVVSGWLNKQIAAELGLSQKTVEVHRAHVMEKMRAGSFAELVRMAVTLEQRELGEAQQFAVDPTLHSG